ncbi:MAG: hypothetical protein WCR08_11185 [Gammaproteobacteria bacterium]
MSEIKMSSIYYKIDSNMITFQDYNTLADFLEQIFKGLLVTTHREQGEVVFNDFFKKLNPNFYGNFAMDLCDNSDPDIRLAILRAFQQGAQNHDASTSLRRFRTSDNEPLFFLIYGTTNIDVYLQGIKKTFDLIPYQFIYIKKLSEQAQAMENNEGSINELLKQFAEEENLTQKNTLLHHIINKVITLTSQCNLPMMNPNMSDTTTFGNCALY